MSTLRVDTIRNAAGTGSPVILGGSSAKSADYTVLDDDGISAILMTTGASDRTVTLPTAADNSGRELTIKKVDSGSGIVIIDGESAETIDGQLTLEVRQQYDSVRLACDGSNWHILEFLTTEVLTASTTSLSGQTGVTAGTWYQTTTAPLSLVVLPGTWELEYFASIQDSDGVNRALLTVASTLSTTTNSETDPEFTCYNSTDTAGDDHRTFVTPASRSKQVTVTSNTTYYLLIANKDVSGSDLFFRGDKATTVIRARRIK